MSNDKHFEFCVVCKLNHNQGRRHNFLPNHKKSLAAVLSRFQSKLSDIRFFLRNPVPLRPEHASRNRLWCIFCESDILELDSFYSSENAIRHLAGADHMKKVKGFLWKYGGGMDKVDTFRITETDFAKWEKKCNLLKKGALDGGSHATSIGPSNGMRDHRYLKTKCVLLQMALICTVRARADTSVKLLVPPMAYQMPKSAWGFMGQHLLTDVLMTVL